jgi:hypothetical protein
VLHATQAHAPELFACGIAKSGAYNRTLTPFGFQAEERTLWQATDVYMRMSPFLNVRRPLPCNCSHAAHANLSLQHAYIPVPDAGLPSCVEFATTI